MKKEIFSGIKSNLCKYLSGHIILLLMALLWAFTCSGQEISQIEKIEVSFDYQHMPTLASNQLAVWIENEDGKVVRTLLVSGFTAGRRGYRQRTMALSGWVESADPESMSDEEIDSISGATPDEGHLVYSWDMTDEDGRRVPDGVYTICVEGTLFWESNVLFSTQVETGKAESGDLPVKTVRSEPDNPENEDMIQDVKIAVLMGKS